MNAQSVIGLVVLLGFALYAWVALASLRRWYDRDLVPRRDAQRAEARAAALAALPPDPWEKTP